MNHPFQEKKFILHLLKNYEEENGNNAQFVKTHKFGILTTEVESKFPFLHDGNMNIGSLTKHWFNEATSRGYLIKQSSIYYLFSEDGYKKAIDIKHPVKTFIKNHWMWSLGILLTIINIGTVIVRLLLCQ